jgi:hypothetical protein
VVIHRRPRQLLSSGPLEKELLGRHCRATTGSGAAARALLRRSSGNVALSAMASATSLTGAPKRWQPAGELPLPATRAGPIELDESFRQRYQVDSRSAIRKQALQRLAARLARAGVPCRRCGAPPDCRERLPVVLYAAPEGTPHTEGRSSSTGFATSTADVRGRGPGLADSAMVGGGRQFAHYVNKALTSPCESWGRASARGDAWRRCWRSLSDAVAVTLAAQIGPAPRESRLVSCISGGDVRFDHQDPRQLTRTH